MKDKDLSGMSASQLSKIAEKMEITVFKQGSRFFATHRGRYIAIEKEEVICYRCAIARAQEFSKNIAKVDFAGDLIID